MKIYFAGSIRGGRDDQKLYLKLINYLSRYGQVLTEHIGNRGVTDLGENLLSNQYIFRRDLAWFKSTDCLVAEVTTPSLGVGYELGLAESLGKKILCLYRPQPGKRLSAMIAGNPKLKTVEYQNLPQAQKHLDTYLKNI